MTGDIRRLGAAVLIQGQAMSDHLRALQLVLPQIERRNAFVPSSLRLLEAELRRAIAADGRKDAAVVPSPATSEVGVLLTVDEVAFLAGVRPRQVRNLAGRLGGRKVASVWLFDRNAVEEEIRRRQQR